MTYMNDSIDWIGAEETRMRKHEEECKKDERRKETRNRLNYR